MYLYSLKRSIEGTAIRLKRFLTLYDMHNHAKMSNTATNQHKQDHELCRINLANEKQQGRYV
jgi:hypothetical protein